MKQILVAVALVMVGLVPGISQATTIFSDNFNGENLQLNHPGFPVAFPAGFANWTVTNGTVDLIGAPGFFDISPDATHGRYVDLDGSTFDPGIMHSTPTFALNAGTFYDLTFDLAGSQRGDSNTVTFGIDLNNNGLFDDGALLKSTITLPGTLGDLFVLHTLTFSGVSSSAASIIFTQDPNNLGQSDNKGLLLDNVALNSRAAVPEPASLMLLGAGLAAIGIWRRKAAKV